MTPAPFPTTVTGTINIGVTQVGGVSAKFAVLVGGDGVVTSILPGGVSGETRTVTMTAGTGAATLTAAGDGDDELTVTVTNAAGAVLCSSTLAYETT